MEFKHTSILLKESVAFLITDKNGIYVDCTMGGAGHTCGFASQLEAGGLILGIDQDEDAIKVASERLLGKFPCQTKVAKSNFKNFAQVLDQLGIEKIDGIFFDLGVSSYQLDCPERGFSYMHNGPLDMRMNQEAKLDAAYVVNNYKEEELAEIIHQYGEERWSKRIAQFIVAAPAQRKQAASLIRRECCCCEDGNCIVLDDGDTCTCPQTISFSVCCKWFRWAVLPLDGTLEAEIFRDKDLKRCAVCGGVFVPKSNRAKYCPGCAARVHRRQKTESERKRRSAVDS